MIKKIELNRRANELGSEEGEQQESQLEEEYNKDKALKNLYDESVNFKNSLAELRSKIKTMNNLFNSYDEKCNILAKREFDEYKSLKTKLEAEKRRIEESDVLSDKRMEERTNRLKVMQIEFLKQYQQAKF